MTSFGGLEQHLGEDLGNFRSDAGGSGESEFTIFSARPIAGERIGISEMGPTRRFAAAASASGSVLAALSNGEVTRWYPIEDEASQIDFGRDRCTDVSRVFVEPKGYHAIVTNHGGDSWYLNFQQDQAKLLPKLRGHIIEAVSWDVDSTANSTKDLILGTVDGQLLHLVVEGKERTMKTLFVFELGGGGGSGGAVATQPVCGVHREKTVLSSDGSDRQVVFAAAGCGVYAFVGPSLDTLFQKYQGEGAALRALVYEVPRDSPHGDLQVDTAAMGPPTSKVLFWLTGVGVLAATIKCPIEGDKDVLESPPGLIPFPRSPKARVGSGSLVSTLLPPPPPAPLCMALMRYHVIFLFEDRWAAVSRITHEVVQQQEWSRSSYGALRVLSRDAQGEQLWMCSDKYLFEIVADREDRDVWSLLLRLEKFDDALTVCRSASQRNRVLAAHADWLFRKGKLVDSARKFAEATSVPFEHVALRFAGPEKKAALLEYLRCRLGACPTDDKVAQALLGVWAVEMSLAYLNDLTFKTGPCSQATEIAPAIGDKLGADKAVQRRRQSAVQEALANTKTQERARLQELLRSCAPLDVHATIYHLLQSHGWLEELTVFAEARQDYVTATLHHVSRRDFAGAVKKLGDFQVAGECEDLICRFAPVLFGAEPRAFVSLLLRSQLSGIAPLSVLPAVCASPMSTSEKRREAIRYLEHAVRTYFELASQAPAVGESLLTRGGVLGRGGHGSVANSLLLDGDLMSGVGEDAAPGTSPATGRGWASGAAVLGALVVLHAQECGPLPAAGTEAAEDLGLEAHEAVPAPAPTVDPEAEENLLRFLAGQEGNPLLDLHFALRVCNERGLARAVVQLYGLMGLHEEAVDVALKRGDLALAKHNAQKPADKRLRQKLWLQIVKSQASVGDAQTIVQTIASLIRESQELSVRDVLPYMSDMITIDAFQAEICDCLDKYKDQVLTLRQEMDDHRHALQAFKEDLKKVEERVVVIPEDQACEICSAPAVKERFYAFPCRHCYHEACLRALVTPTLDEDTRQHLFALEAKRIEHQALVAGSAPGSGSGNTTSEKEIAEVEDELDGILADDCPLCGQLMIKSIRRPFIDPEDVAEAETWSLD
eukprot:TRINITY_DN12718_c0_g1_i1.p1 TRINITY_DN12718_c0_g1~~TRINITY_DN12718_c0_g1_i1.p1  ORF type:complete len:1121 (-),score=260.65 TRINITY_DN12718_c0_g1_i1:52-3384(-)